MLLYFRAADDLGFEFVFFVVVVGVGALLIALQKISEGRREQERIDRLDQDLRIAPRIISPSDHPPIRSEKEIKEDYAKAVATSPVHLEFLSLFVKGRSLAYLVADPRDWTAELGENFGAVLGKMSLAGLLKRTSYRGETRYILSSQGALLVVMLAPDPRVKEAARKRL